MLKIENLPIKVNNKSIIENLSIIVNEAENVAIIGENGAGKTTLLKSIIENFSNKNFIDLKSKNKNIGYVPQFREINEEYPLSSFDFVALPLKQKILPWLTKKEICTVKNIFRELKIENLINKRIGILSGGERQKVFLAQALINNPKVLLLDEFTSNLDKKSELDCIKLVSKLTKEKKIITLCITHELSLLEKEHFDKILYLEKNNYIFTNVDDYKKENINLKTCRHNNGGINV